MKIETELREEIHSEFEELKRLEVGTDTYKTTVDGITKLIDRAIEIEKLGVESSANIQAQEELELKRAQIDDERKDRVVKNLLSAAGIAIPTAVAIWGTIKSFEFEKEGTITTIMGRGFINKLLPKK